MSHCLSLTALVVRLAPSVLQGARELSISIFFLYYYSENVQKMICFRQKSHPANFWYTYNTFFYAFS